MKNLYLVVIILFLVLSSAQAQNKKDIQLLASELHSDYYKEETYAKDVFVSYVKNDSLFKRFPDVIRSFEFAPKTSLEEYITDCDLRVRKLKKQFDGQQKSKDFEAFWKENLRPCYAKYIQTSPEFRFAFELQKSNVIYHINEVIVYIYSTRIPLSTDKDYFEHKKDEREKLIIDITKIGQNQFLELNQTHAVKDGGLALNLRLFSSDYWKGSFERSKVLLHISFKFTNGQIIQSEPFMVEM
ncbi:hypothetical protein [uncultured Aquimarina sp.]|uniref:hypothetical protein n=1 Tax=uncultured Aquimarina sp. TaxID=575652 RepID=UPI002622F311|nr:hypothetical protein [uncultured Aquimarina sp.]